MLNTPLVLNNLDANFTYGLDAQRDITSQPLVDGRIWVPEMDMLNLAPFVQTKFTFFDKLMLKGGVRYEKVNIGVDDYATLPTKNTTTGVVTPIYECKRRRFEIQCAGIKRRPALQSFRLFFTLCKLFTRV